MSGSEDTPPGPASYWVLCPKCGELYLSIYATCPNCTLTVAAEGIIDTHDLARRPMVAPGPRRQPDALTQTGQIVLQFLPSGVCLTLGVAQPTVLGRRTSDALLNGYELVDLTNYGGYRHGVSRAHCVLERRNETLMVIDLGSRNGTYLNDRRLIPHAAEQVVHSDRLILGTLHALIAFTPVE
jgi:hypothetical protein